MIKYSGKLELPAAEIIQGVALLADVFWLTTNSDVTGTQKLNHLFLRELFPNTRTQYKHMKDLSWVSLQRIPEQSFLEVTRPF